MDKDTRQDDAEELWEDYWAEPSDARRNRLAEHYHGLLTFHARRMAERLCGSVDADDMIAPGFFGLVRAIERFDPMHGVTFATFASPRIRGAMLDEIRDLDWVPRLERRRHKAGEIDDVTQLISLETITGSHDGNVVTLGETLPDRSITGPDATKRRRDFWRIIAGRMDKRSALLLLLYYREGRKMREIGAELGMSEPRVSQLHSDLLGLLKSGKAYRLDELYDCLEA